MECDVAHLDAFFSRLERTRKFIEQLDGTTVHKPQHAANTRPHGPGDRQQVILALGECWDAVGYAQ